MTTTSDKTFLQSVIRMMDTLAASGNYDTIGHLLSLLCLFSILNQGGATSAAAPVQQSQQSGVNPLQKLLGDLTGGALAAPSGAGSPLGGLLGALGSPDMLMSLLPLLNNPQLKAKLNPANIASVMGMLNNLGGMAGAMGTMGAGNEKGEKKNTAQPQAPMPSQAPAQPAPQPAPPFAPQPAVPTAVPPPVQPDNAGAAAPTAAPVETPAAAPAVSGDVPESAPARKSGSRFLNWKTNF